MKLKNLKLIRYLDDNKLNNNLKIFWAILDDEVGGLR